MDCERRYPLNGTLQNFLMCLSPVTFMMSDGLSFSRVLERRKAAGLNIFRQVPTMALSIFFGGEIDSE